ncbi:CvpA family protein [Paenibacillus sp. CC-CFT747]|nr:CvpA family protein [Paenibacillus sp. CC-CFT747]
MTTLDVAVTAGFLFALVVGYRRGLIGQLVSLAGLILAYLAAYKYAGALAPVLAKWLPLEAFFSYKKYEYAVQSLRLEDYILRALAFALIFFAVKIALSVIGHVLNVIAQVPGLNSLNRWGGAALSFLEAALLFWVLVHVLSVVPSDPIQQAMARSRLATFVMDSLPGILDTLPFWPGKNP